MLANAWKRLICGGALFLQAIIMSAGEDVKIKLNPQVRTTHDVINMQYLGLLSQVDSNIVKTLVWNIVTNEMILPSPSVVLCGPSDFLVVETRDVALFLPPTTIKIFGCGTNGSQVQQLKARYPCGYPVYAELPANVSCIALAARQSDSFSNFSYYEPRLGLIGKLLDGGLCIVDVKDDGPAAKAGVMGGDKVVAINGHPIILSREWIISQLVLSRFNSQSRTVLRVCRNGLDFDIEIAPKNVLLLRLYQLPNILAYTYMKEAETIEF